MADIIARVGPCRFAPRADGSHFHHVVRSIVFQQLSGSAASTIHRRVVALFRDAEPTPAQLAATTDRALRDAGLSRQKIGYLRDLARHVLAGDLPIESLHALDDADVIAALTQVKGIGVWTAQMFLMFRLGRPDILPDLDLGIRKAIQRAYRTRGLPPPHRVQRIGAVWAPHRTIASWYLWRSLETEPAPRSRATTRKPKPGGRRRRA